MQSIDIENPRNNDPESPINIFAGDRLNHKKPARAPIKAKENLAAFSSP